MPYRSGSYTLFHHRYHIGRLGTEIPLQGTDRRGSPAGEGYHPPGLRREGGDHRQRGLVARSRASVCRDPAAHLGQPIRAAGQRAFVAADTAGNQAHPKTLLGQRFWARGYFSTTSGNITDDVITAYLERHTAPHSMASAYRPDPTGFGR